jgi:hypothetical protein
MNNILHAQSDTGVVIEPASLRDLGALRRIEHICFLKDAWPLLDLIGVLTFGGVIRLKAVSDQQILWRCYPNIGAGGSGLRCWKPVKHRSR